MEETQDDINTEKCCEIIHSFKSDFDKCIHDEDLETKATPIIVVCMKKYGEWLQNGIKFYNDGGGELPRA